MRQLVRVRRLAFLTKDAMTREFANMIDAAIKLWRMLQMRRGPREIDR